MTRFHFERPDGPLGNNAQNILIHLNEFVPPQGYGGSLRDQMAYEDSDIMGYEVDWFNLQFQQRIPLTINGGQVPSTQTNFPLLINDTYPELIGEVEAELRFAGSDNIQLEYEIEEFDSVTGKLVAWMKKPSVSNGDIINIYFDNPGAIDEQDPGSVWSDYNAVYHLNQTTFGSLSTIDSSPNNEDGTPQSMDISNQVPGQINGSLNFAGSFEFIEMSDSSGLDPVSGGWTVLAWIIADDDGRMDIVAKQRAAAPNDGWAFRLSNSGNDRKLFILMRDNGVITVRGTQQISLDVLHHVVFTYDGSGNASGVRLFIDGVEDTINIELDTLVGGISTDVIFNIANLGGSSPIPALLWNGIIDEANILNTEKTPDFITTVFNNQNSQSTFYSTGIVESVPSVVIMGYES